VNINNDRFTAESAENAEKPLNVSIKNSTHFVIFFIYFYQAKPLVM
jgi:hypothetical protein